MATIVLWGFFGLLVWGLMSLLCGAITSIFEFLMALNPLYLRLDRYFQSGWTGRILVGGGLIFGMWCIVAHSGP